MARPEGFEPPTTWFEVKCSSFQPDPKNSFFHWDISYILRFSYPIIQLHPVQSREIQHKSGGKSGGKKTTLSPPTAWQSSR